MKTYKQFVNEARLDEAKFAVIMKASAAFGDPDRLAKGQIEWYMDAITGEMMPKDPKEAINMGYSKSELKRWIKDNNIVYGSKEELMAAADESGTGESLRSVLKKPGNKIKKV